MKVFTTFSCLLLSVAVSAQEIRFDPSWWRRTIHDEERTGFVLGYLDCPKAPKMVPGASSNDYVAYVFTHLGSTSRLANVPSVLKDAHLHMHSRPILKGGEEYSEKYSWLDGAWWGDAKHGDIDDKTGYVEGYLACEFGTATSSQTRRFVDTLNRHFAVAKNQHDKVANVLQSILEHERKRS